VLYLRHNTQGCQRSKWLNLGRELTAATRTVQFHFTNGGCGWKKGSLTQSIANVQAVAHFKMVTIQQQAVITELHNNYKAVITGHDQTQTVTTSKSHSPKW